LRDVIVRRDPLCRRCEAAGRLTVTALVDHILPIWLRPDLRLDPDNLQGLCKPCHDAKTAEDLKQHGPPRPTT
jgi:5-methylcytosine-specific restriction protein A